eukprot:17697_1
MGNQYDKMSSQNDDSDNSVEHKSKISKHSKKTLKKSNSKTLKRSKNQGELQLDDLDATRDKPTDDILEETLDGSPKNWSWKQVQKWLYEEKLYDFMYPVLKKGPRDETDGDTLLDLNKKKLTIASGCYAMYNNNDEWSKTDVDQQIDTFLHELTKLRLIDMQYELSLNARKQATVDDLIEMKRRINMFIEKWDRILWIDDYVEKYNGIHPTEEIISEELSVSKSAAEVYLHYHSKIDELKARDIDELLLESHSISMIVSKTLNNIKKTWDMYADNDNINSNKHYAHNASYTSNLSEDPYELRNQKYNDNSSTIAHGNDKKSKAEKIAKKKNEEQINQLKKILLRKFLFLFVIASKIDYHHISRQNNTKKSRKTGKNNEYKRIFDCSLLYWFVRSIYYYQRASIPYILALFRDECDILALNLLWESIQINVKCCDNFETFLYLSPFINFFDAIDCFLRSSDQKRSIQSPELLKSTQRTQKTAKLVFKMIEIDLSLPVPSNRRFPVEGILLAKMSSRSQHQTEFINLLKTIQQTTLYWDDREKTQYLTSMFQRYHSTISRILDWNWIIHDSYYTFCQINDVLQIGIATQESNMITKMQHLTIQQFNDIGFGEFVSKWYQYVFNQQISDALLANTNINSKLIKKFLRNKLARPSISVSTLTITSPSHMNAMQRSATNSLAYPNYPSLPITHPNNLRNNNFDAHVGRLHSSSIMTDSKNTNTFEWFSKQCLNETSDAIILMIENFVKQGKEELALNLLQHLLSDGKYSGDDGIFDQLIILIANPHYYRLPLIFQALLGKLLNYIHWFPPNELQEIPPSMKLTAQTIPNLNRAMSPLLPSWNIADLPLSEKPSRDHFSFEKGIIANALVDNNKGNGNGNKSKSVSPKPEILQSRTSFSDEKLEPEVHNKGVIGVPPPPALGAPGPSGPARTALRLIGGYSYSYSNRNNIPPPPVAPYKQRKIKPGSIMDKQRKRNSDKQRTKLQKLFGTNDFPELPDSMCGSMRNLYTKNEMNTDMTVDVEARNGELSPHAVISPNSFGDNNNRLLFDNHVLTFEEKKEIMGWLSTYCCVSIDMDMYSFWDVVLLNIINLPMVLNIDDYDTNLFSDTSQILSPKMKSVSVNNDNDNDDFKLDNYEQKVVQLEAD